MAKQAAMKTKDDAPPAPPQDKQALEAAGMAPDAKAPGIPATNKPPSAPAGKTPSPQDLQSIGSGIGDALRTFREAANDVRRAVDPQMHTIKAEMEAAQKELQASIDYVKESPKIEEPPK